MNEELETKCAEALVVCLEEMTKVVKHEGSERDTKLVAIKAIMEIASIQNQARLVQLAIDGDNDAKKSLAKNLDKLH
jgi:hypothetical protein